MTMAIARDFRDPITLTPLLNSCKIYYTDPGMFAIAPARLLTWIIVFERCTRHSTPPVRLKFSQHTATHLWSVCSRLFTEQDNFEQSRWTHSTEDPSQVRHHLFKMFMSRHIYHRQMHNNVYTPLSCISKKTYCVLRSHFYLLAYIYNNFSPETSGRQYVFRVWWDDWWEQPMRGLRRG